MDHYENEERGKQWGKHTISQPDVLVELLVPCEEHLQQLAHSSGGDSSGQRLQSRGQTYQRFQCNWCNKFCSSSFQLERHMRVHTGETPFECEQCDARFAARCNLVEHLSRHDASLPHACSLCQWRYRNVQALSKHCSDAHGVKLENWKVSR